MRARFDRRVVGDAELELIQDGAGGANLAAARGAWPLTLAFLRRHLK